MSESDPIRVIIVDDDVVLTDALGLLWERGGDIEMVGVAHTAAEGIGLARRELPHVVLMDHHLPDRTGADATESLSKEIPGVAIIILTMDDSDEALLAGIEAGASGFLVKQSGIREVSDAVRRAAAGEMLIDPATIVRLTAAIRGRRRRESEGQLLLERLTGRELEVLQLMATGLDTRAMAESLTVGQATVRSHAAAVLSKLGAHSRLEAVARATRAGILR
jgi:two-component system, NarL family, nitrate/nitrite response regulator NarL